MAYPTIVKDVETTIPSLTSTTNTGTITAATAGNLLVVMLAGDKNTGTLTVTDNIDTAAGAWTETVEVPGASVSRYMAWKVAKGGETTVTVTTSAASTTGNTGRLMEISQAGAAAWAAVAISNPAYNDTPVGSRSTGTTDTAEYEGIGIAINCVDSQNTMTGTLSWTNGYVARSVPTNPAGSGGGNAACFTATKGVDANTTTETTFATTAGTDNMSAALVVFARQVSAGPTVPTVNAGADASVGTGGTFTRTATESDGGAAITSRAWTIVSGPSGAGTTIGTAAALSWPVGPAGAYVLRYVATNSVGASAPDDVTVTVTAPTRSLLQAWVGIDQVVVKTSSSVGGEQARIAFSTSSAMTSPVYSSALVTPDGAGISKHTLPALTPNTSYWYQVELGGALIGASQAFKTLPGTSPQSFSFAFASCRDDADSFPSPNPTAFANAQGRGINFFLEIGDFHYRDINSTDASLYHAAYDELFTRSNIANLLKAVPTGYVWDDHDYCGDQSNGGSTGKATVQGVYRNRIPHSNLPSATGIYQTFIVGRVRIIMLDSRSFRSPSGNTDDANKTMLGTEQKTWLKGLLDNATTPYTLIVSPVGWVGGVETGQDHWGMYQTERSEIGGWITANVGRTKVVFLSGDAHMLAIDDGTNAVAGTPAYHAAALNQFTSTKGGPYSGGTLAGNNQFGLVEVTDDGTNISVKYSGIKTDNTVWNTHTTTVTTLGGSGVEPGRFFLAY